MMVETLIGGFIAVLSGSVTACFTLLGDRRKNQMELDRTLLSRKIDAAEAFSGDLASYITELKMYGLAIRDVYKDTFLEMSEQMNQVNKDHGEVFNRERTRTLKEKFSKVQLYFEVPDPAMFDETEIISFKHGEEVWNMIIASRDIGDVYGDSIVSKNLELSNYLEKAVKKYNATLDEIRNQLKLSLGK